MSIDPRMLSELIKVQLMNGSMIGQNGDAAMGASNGQPNVFNSIFQLAMMMQQQADPSGKIITDPVPSTDMTTSSNSSIFGAVSSFPAYLMKAETFEPMVQRASVEHQVPSAFIRAVMQAESGFNPNAVSSAGAKGLMQLMDGTAEGLGVTDSFDPEQNIMGGTKYLAGLLKEFNGNEAIAAAAYNAGPGRIEKLGIHDQASLEENYARLPMETQTYVKRVMDNRDEWSARETKNS